MGNKKLARQLLFIGYYDITRLDAAPKVRISEMSKAFRSMGTESFIIGNARKRAFMKLKWMLTNNSNIKYAYIEGSTSTAYPMDLLFLLYLKIKKIRIAYFMRDAHPLYKNFSSLLKWYQKPLYWGWHFSVKIYQHLVDDFFSPTLFFNDIFSFGYKQFQVLPPAISGLRANLFDTHSKHLLYVGGLSSFYGIEKIEALLCFMEENEPQFRLHIITREAELGRIKKHKNCTIESLNYDDLPTLSSKYFAGLLTISGEYADLALSVKMFDYFSLGLPIIMTESYSHRKFIEETGAGFVADSDEPIETFIQNILKQPEVLNSAVESINRVIPQDHTWTKRARTVLDTLGVKD